MERTIDRNEQAYKNMEAVAKMLEAMSPNGARYTVKDVYFDFGQNWMWTTICREGYCEAQVLCPRDWKAIITATTISELAAVAEEIRNDKFFGDR